MMMILAANLAVAPSAVADPRSGDDRKTGTGDIPKPEAVKADPVEDARHPSLVVKVAADQPTVQVGGTVKATVSVANESEHDAKDLEVVMPLPEGATSVGDGGRNGWRWTRGTLRAGSTSTFTAELKATTMPRGRALLTRVRATADGLGQPVEDIGGAVVTEPSDPSPEGSPARGRVEAAPGRQAVLTSSDGQIEVTLPAGATRRPFVLQARKEADKRARNEPVPSDVAGTRRGLGTFFLEAQDDSGAPVHQFDGPLTISVRYTPEQLQARGIAEDDLTLFWFDEAHKTWVPQATAVDPASGRATAEVDHFSAFQLGDGSSPSAAFIPSVQGWQVNHQTGSASHSLSIDVPAGPAGIKPSIELTYNSAATDGDTGKRPKQQAGWAGKGWNLDPGSVARNKISINPATNRWVDHFTLTLNGQSFDLVRGDPLPGNTGPEDPNPSHWAWNPTDETFIRARAVPNGTSTDGSPGRGGMVNGVWQPRHSWRIWAKNGVVHEFADDAWWGFDRCAVANTVDFEAYRWQLSTTTDTHGNTVTYRYDRNSVAGAQKSCDASNYARGTVDRDVWLKGITWGANPGTGAVDRYKADFISSARTNDTAFEGATNQYAGINGQPRQTRRLDAIAVLSKPAATWELVRRYNLAYDFSLLSDQTIKDAAGVPVANPSFPKLTLKSIQRVGSDGVTALPKATFSYETSRGTAVYPKGGWNRLTLADNGQGGLVSFAYDNLGAVLGRGLFSNNNRVAARNEDDGRGNRATWQMAYGTANYNSRGTTLAGVNAGTQANPNSAALYFNKYWDPLHANESWLAHRPLKEFRGHDYVRETAPDGTQTEHWYYLGDHSCGYPRDASGNPLKGDAILTNPCFVELRNREFLRGKEYRTRALAPSGAVLHDTEHTFTVEPLAYSQSPLTGLWRAFAYESQNVQRAHNGAADPVTTTTRYVYDPALQVGGRQYGNLTSTEVYGDSGALERVTQQFFTTRDDANGAYLLDRPWMEVVRDGQRRLLAVTQHFYDGADQTSQTVGTKGDLTRTSKYSNVPLQADALGVTLASSDTTYGYDPYGNTVTTATYAGSGTRLWNGGGSLIVSPAGGGSAARTNRTVYDPTFHVHPIQTMGPTGLTGSAGYDGRMGVLTSVTDANGNTSNARYDAFGRLVKLIKPGDTESMATVDAFYYDSEKPFRYVSCHREIAGQAGCRPQQQYYDGLGRLIQTKSESAEAAQNIVIDTVYDGHGRSVKQSQPRYRNETPASTFWQYVPPGADADMRWTSTSYDGLSRPSVVVEPDGSRKEHSYSVTLAGATQVVAHDVIDANRHRVQHRHDAFGRLVQVQELAGECDGTASHPCGAGDAPWSPYATTTYAYNPLDLLTSVADARGNTTSMSYDSLGRKLAMADPDMGAWRYEYDPNGNLVAQVDAKAGRMTFAYDALDRMTTKVAADGATSTFRYDEAVPNGKGQRTSMASATETTVWQFDARSRPTRTDHTVGKISRSFVKAYDSADRVESVTYPSGERVTYGHDAGWRPVSLCSGSGCYVQNATWTALDQPDVWRFGSSLTQDWSYEDLTQRLAELTVGGHFDRTYGYDKTGNVKTIGDRRVGGATQSFEYDHRDRLVSWTPSAGARAAKYAYNTIGNLTSKDGQAYDYAPQSPANGGPHAVKAKGADTYRYDANGNLVAGGGREIMWNADNLPAAVKGPDGVVERYGYDGHGTRVTKERAGVTTTLLEGMWEETPGAQPKSYYVFGGQSVAVRQGTAVTYLHGDHLGSVGLATNQTGGLVSRQEFDPWGKVRSGGVAETDLNYTGQRLDQSGLLDYSARLYDPSLARFVSADSIVPGPARARPSFGTIGRDGGSSLRTLAVDFHEQDLAKGLRDENAFTADRGFHFQLDGSDLRNEVSPWGPADPQALNRYSYVLNNPQSYTDPTGHQGLLPPPEDTSIIVKYDDVDEFLNEFDRNVAATLSDQQLMADIIALVAAALCAPSGVGVIVCGAFAATFSKIIKDKIVENYYTVRGMILAAKKAAGPGGYIIVYGDASAGSVTVVGVNAKGRIVYEATLRGTWAGICCIRLPGYDVIAPALAKAAKSIGACVRAPGLPPPPAGKKCT